MAGVCYIMSHFVTIIDFQYDTMHPHSFFPHLSKWFLYLLFFFNCLKNSAGREERESRRSHYCYLPPPPPILGGQTPEPEMKPHWPKLWPLRSFQTVFKHPSVKFFQKLLSPHSTVEKTTLIGIPISVYKEFYILSSLILVTIHELIQSVIFILIFQIQNRHSETVMWKILYLISDKV